MQIDIEIRTIVLHLFFIPFWNLKIWHKSFVVFQVVDPAISLICVPDLVGPLDEVAVHRININWGVVFWKRQEGGMYFYSFWDLKNWHEAFVIFQAVDPAMIAFDLEPSWYLFMKLLLIASTLTGVSCYGKDKGMVEGNLKNIYNDYLTSKYFQRKMTTF